MSGVRSWGGKDLRDMFAAGGSWLEKSVADINSINVFPVPDGDTGTNMFLTMRSTLEEADRAPNHSVSAMADAMAHGALMGARGNSGVILSQIFRGLAKGLEGKETFDGEDWAKALVQASRTAYEGLSQPVEGTILTVVRDAAMSADMAAKSKPEDLTYVTEVAVEAAKASVAKTPFLLPVLRDAGVVDAGGQGLYVLLEGALRYLKGEMEEMQNRRPQMITANLPSSPEVPQIIAAEAEEPYGYCTNLLLQGRKLNLDKIRSRLEKEGKSLVVVGDENTVRVHIHTYDPGAVMRYATSLGTLHQIQVQNMDDQHVGFVEMQQAKLSAPDIAVVAVAAGNGMIEVFKSLGTAAVVTGGQTMNPSVREVLQAVESVASQKVILLPDNKNIILTASQIEPLTSKEVVIVPTKTMPQGIAALLAFNYDGNLEENVQAMNEAMAMVKTVEVTKAVRSTKINDLKVKKGQTIALVDDRDLVAVGDNVAEVLFEALDKAGIESAEVVTLYYGADVEATQAEEMIQEIRNKYPEKQIELVRGGQPHYDYVVSLE